MRLKLTTIAVTAACVVSAFAAPEVKFSGYLDADAWCNLRGNFYTNNELDLGVSVDFNEKVSSHVYGTVRAGFIPAGSADTSGAPQMRWSPFTFDGFDFTYKSKIGTFSVGDLVYQYGKFNYYFYKRRSMITTENFTRGIKYENGNEIINQSVSIGVADLDEHTGDVIGSTNLKFGENHSLGLYYGIRGSAIQSFKAGTNFFAGAEYLGTFGETVKLKADFGYLNNAGAERSKVYTLLLEPSLSFGKFTTALTGYLMIDPDTINDVTSKSRLLGLSDEAFVYVEPGYTFNDYLGLGFPLEVHAGNIDNKDDNSFWAVPTFYVYPTTGIQWWIWGQVVVPMHSGITKDDLGLGLGSEIIVTF